MARRGPPTQSSIAELFDENDSRRGLLLEAPQTTVCQVNARREISLEERVLRLCRWHHLKSDAVFEMHAPGVVNVWSRQLFEEQLSEQGVGAVADQAFIDAAGIALARSRCIRGGFLLPPAVVWFLFGPDGRPDEAPEDVSELYLWVLARRGHGDNDDSLELRTWASSVARITSESKTLKLGV